MSTTRSTTPSRQKLNLVPYTPSPSTTPPSSTPSTPINVDLTYRIVSIKPANTDWLTPSPSDLVQITGPVFKRNTTVSHAEETAAEAEDGFQIPCAAHLTWDDRSVSLKCLYHSSAGILTDVGDCADETVDKANEADRVNSVAITMQDAIFCKGKLGNVTVKEEDMRDDNGNPFMVLHVNIGLGRSVRLYCKKVSYRQICLTDERSDLEESGEEVGDQIDSVG